MSVVPIWCAVCTAVRPHVANDERVSCIGCGNIRRDLGEGLAVAALTVAELAPVDDMRFCAWCNERKPVGHDCPAGAVGCTAGRDDGTTCGECGPCTRAQTQDLAARDAEFRLDPYGSPSDIDHP